MKKLKGALTLTRTQLEELKRELQSEPSNLESGYIDPTILMLQDPLLTEKVEQRLRAHFTNVEWAFDETVNELASHLLESDDAYFRERAPDVVSIGKKVIENMLGAEGLTIPEGVIDPIVVAHTLSPPEMIFLYKNNVRAVVTEIGGKTSHVSIMARDLEIPAVVGVADVSSKVKTGERIIVDGTIGIVIRIPEQDTVTLYEFKKKEAEKYEARLKKIENTPCRMQDGCSIS